ncbi:MAG TPA: cation transporter, partial [Candidatus Binatia bacterium]|nr:cation transporter [Candidatus Binatia bacterium]
MQAPAITSDRIEPQPGSRAVTQLAVDGMTCGNCARHVTQALQGVPGVQTALVNLEGHQATVRWQPQAHPDPAAAVKAVEAEGYGAKVIEDVASEHGDHKLAGWQLNLWLGLPATALLMLGEWVFRLGMVRWFQWFAFAVAGVVQVLAGARFYRGALAQLRARSSNMDTLVALGSTTAFGYSVWALLSGQGGHVYFMEAAAIVTLISLGHWMESRVSVRASSALRKLLDLAPALARRRLPDSRETEVPAAELQAGELVALRPGDRIPTDGQVVEGNSAVDESMLTGESTPADKAVRSQLYAGTVNLSGRLVMRV